MQRQVEQECSECESDFPPGFEIMANSVDTNISDDILEIVLADLHLSVKMSLIEYIESLLEEQVRKVVYSPEVAEFTEVILKLLHDFGCYRVNYAFFVHTYFQQTPIPLPLVQKEKEKC